MSNIQNKRTKTKHAAGSSEGYSRSEIPTQADIKRAREAMKAKGYTHFTPKQTMRMLFGK